MQLSTTVRLFIDLRQQNTHNPNIKQSLLLQYPSLIQYRNLYYKNSFYSILSQVVQTSNCFPNRRLERSKTNISRHNCTYYTRQHRSWTYKAEHPKLIPAHLSLNPKADSLGVFLCDKRTLRGTSGNVVTYHRAGGGAGGDVLWLPIFLTTNHIVTGVKYWYRHDSLNL
jgi:hypothetical protein